MSISSPRYSRFNSLVEGLDRTRQKVIFIFIHCLLIFFRTFLDRQHARTCRCLVILILYLRCTPTLWMELILASHKVFLTKNWRFSSPPNYDDYDRLQDFLVLNVLSHAFVYKQYKRCSSTLPSPMASAGFCRTPVECRNSIWNLLEW